MCNIANIQCTIYLIIVQLCHRPVSDLHISVPFDSLESATVCYKVSFLWTLVILQ